MLDITSCYGGTSEGSSGGILNFIVHTAPIFIVSVYPLLRV